MPWYFRIIVYLNFPFSQDNAFQIAKRKISANQNILKDKNERIINYFKEGKIPYVSHIFNEFQMEEKEFQNFIRENNFVTYNMNQPEAILLYPKILN